MGESHVPRGGSVLAIACHPERQRMTHEGGVRLSVLASVSTHVHPTGSSFFHAHLHDILHPPQYQVEVTESVDREPYSSPLPGIRHDTLWLVNKNKELRLEKLVFLYIGDCVVLSLGLGFGFVSK
ncbi:hypothetical protein V6N12_064829 [Hibiscus sabdariffa]|uniref:Uncharacterized protein n=1 Tax=Hibiscus sabdariffa TaxID=183260 RepID=A0ABR2G8B9_9ROSI